VARFHLKSAANPRHQVISRPMASVLRAALGRLFSFLGVLMRNAFLGAAIIVCMALPASANTLALGDSLAVGAGQALHVETVARIAASSCAILRSVPARHFGVVVISAGTNDPPGGCVEKIRAAVHADLVIWILPVNGARNHVAVVARAHGDKTVSYAPGPGRLWPHPRSYQPLAAALTAVLRG
jgi:hypothetical protein